MTEDKRWGSSKRERRLILAAMCLALGTVVSAVSSLNVALPDLARELHATQSQLQWIVDSYAVVFAGLLLLAGALGDRIGRRPVLLAGLALFAAAAAGGLVADSPGALIAVRAVMGVGAAAIMPTTLSIITTVFPADERERAVSIWAGVAGGSALHRAAGLRRAPRAVRVGLDLRLQRDPRRRGPGLRRPGRPELEARPRPPRRGGRRALRARALGTGLRDHRGPGAWLDGRGDRWPRSPPRWRCSVGSSPGSCAGRIRCSIRGSSGCAGSAPARPRSPCSSSPSSASSSSCCSTSSSCSAIHRWSRGSRWRHWQW